MAQLKMYWINDGKDVELFELPEGYSLMEVKTDGAMPLWLSYTLDEYDIFPMSFSKYGKAYADMITKENRGFTNG